VSKRTRNHVMLVVALVAGFVYGWFARAWSDVAYYGGAAVLVVLVGGFGLPWMELAPDGAWRRRPEA
jgi:hypothetical protein